jgi:hypothetical protein
MYLKSQLFLGFSVVSAIAFVGCIFELTSGAPEWGNIPTLAILGGSLPLTILSFLQAVKLAKASVDP